MPKNYCIMQIWAESGKSALPICNYSQILYQFLTFTQNLKRSRLEAGNVPAQLRISIPLLNYQKNSLFLYSSFYILALPKMYYRTFAGDVKIFYHLDYFYLETFNFNISASCNTLETFICAFSAS
jgi:hypothetical protein